MPDQEFKIKWFQKTSTNKFKTKFVLTENEDLLSFDSVMMWNLGDDRTDDSFTLSNVSLEQISKVYNDHDLCYQ